MTYAKLNDREREAFEKAAAAVSQIAMLLALAKQSPDTNISVWEIHNRAIEISAAAYNIHHGIYR